MTTQTEHAVQKPALKTLLKQHKTSMIQYAGLLFVVVLFSILTGGQIFSAYNLRTLVGQTAPLMITCVGVIFMFTNGSMDIASGAVGGHRRDHRRGLSGGPVVGDLTAPGAETKGPTGPTPPGESGPRGGCGWGTRSPEKPACAGSTAEAPEGPRGR